MSPQFTPLNPPTLWQTKWVWEAAPLAAVSALPHFIPPGIVCPMIADVRRYLQPGPFQPFAIITSSGHRYEIPSADHAGMSPEGNRIVIWFDDGGSVTLSALHITAIEKLPSAKKAAA